MKKFHDTLKTVRVLESAQCRWKHSSYTDKDATCVIWEGRQNASIVGSVDHQVLMLYIST